MSFDQLFESLRKIDKEAKAQEEGTKHAFNIFSILRKYDDEVGLHSRFLAEILDPTASHTMPIFQKLFIDEVINPAIENQDWERDFLDSSIHYTCETEAYIKGFGRVDIILKSAENVIIIENKIHAADQKQQLQRYFDACLTLGYSAEHIYILYLNKNGEQVTSYGKGQLRDEDFGGISYRDDITNWLDKCVEKVASYEHIEQTLMQYRRLVSSLTGDSRTAKMKESHVNLLYQDDNFRLAYELSQSLNNFQIDLQKKIWSGLLTVLRRRGYDFRFCDKNLQSCEYNKMIHSYYKARGSTKFYGLQCQIGRIKGYSLHLFIQLNHNIYYGVAVSSNTGRVQYPDSLSLLSAKIASLRNEIRTNDKKWFLGGNMLPKAPINFQEITSLYSITEKRSRDQWVSQTTDEIVGFIEAVKSLELIENTDD